MTMPALIGLDWGTTSLRAYRLAADGTILDRRASAQGILKVANGAFADVFREVVGDWLDDGPPVLASGMIGSRQGWHEAPYAACPAGAAELAGALARIDAGGVAVAFVPGLSIVDDDGVPDVMRGEETQIVGALQDEAAAPAAVAGARVFLLPGTHSKWVRVEDGRVVWFATFMTGELFAVLASHSILGRLMSGEDLDPAAFEDGLGHAARTAERRGGLLHRLFAARTLALFDRLPTESVRGWLSGLLIGSEIAEARAALGGKLGRAPITVIGGDALAASYGRALAASGLEARIAGEAVTARGLAAIARAAGLIGG